LNAFSAAAIPFLSSIPAACPHCGVDNYLLVFVGSNAVTQTGQVFAQPLSPSSAQAIGSGPVPLVAASGTTGQYQSGIVVASDGANFLAVWDVNAPGPAAGTSADAAAVAFAGQNYSHRQSPAARCSP
jgi:hypothetical protein